MIRIAGVNLPGHKHIEIALTHIYGIGRSKANEILKKVGIEKTKKAELLSEEEVDRLRDEVKKHMVEGDLRRFIASNIKKLQDIHCYRWIRHKKWLPVRGQNTKTNAKTRKGKGRTIANKKK